MIPGGFHADDPVVLPSGERAVVICGEGDRVRCRYLRRDLHQDERTVLLPPNLLRRIVNGIVPPPVRINGHLVPD